MTALRDLANSHGYLSTEEAIGDHFVTGVASRRISKRLLLEGSKFTFATQYEAVYELKYELSVIDEFLYPTETLVVSQELEEQMSAIAHE